MIKVDLNVDLRKIPSLTFPELKEYYEALFNIPPFFVIIVRLPLFLTLHPISAPFRPVPAGKLPPVSCPPVPGQWPV